MDLPTPITKLADLLAALPGVGPKQANRLAIHLLGYSPLLAKNLSQQLQEGLDKIQLCTNCGNLAESELCGICANPERDPAVVMVVEGVTDLVALESTSQFSGHYCVLGKLISPLNGVMPDDTNLNLLLARNELQEVIFALPATVEGEATIAYISQALQNKTNSNDLKLTKLARGIAKGVNMEYLDPDTLRAALQNRI